MSNVLANFKKINVTHSVSYDGHISHWPKTVFDFKTTVNNNKFQVYDIFSKQI